MNRDIVFPNNGRGHLINVNVKCYVPGKMWVWKYPYIGEDGYWYYWDEKAGGVIKSDQLATGPEGNGIESVAKTGSDGNVDTYTITFTDGSTTTFTVTNGSDSVHVENFYDEITYSKERIYGTTCYFVEIPVRDSNNDLITPYLKYSADLTPAEVAREEITTFTCNGTTDCKQNESIVHGHVLSRGVSVYNNTLTDVADTFKYVSINADRSVSEFPVNNTTQQDLLDGGAYNVFCAYYKIVESGAAVDNSETLNNEGYNVSTSPYPYSAIGVLSDNTLLFMAADGRTDVDAGLTSDQAAQIMIDKGCVNAWAMDGGGSVSYSVKCAKLNRNIDDHGMTDRMIHITLNVKKENVEENSVADTYSKIGEEKQNTIQQLIPYVNDLYDKIGFTYVEGMIRIQSGTDLNTITGVGRYIATSNPIAASLTNCPTNVAFVMTGEYIASTIIFYMLKDYNGDIYCRRNYIDSGLDHFTAWKKITPASSIIEIDPTFSVEGNAADAKLTGDIFADVGFYDEITFEKGRLNGTDYYIATVPYKDKNNDDIHLYLSYDPDRNPLEAAGHNHTTISINGYCSILRDDEYHNGIAICEGEITNRRSYEGYTPDNCLYLGVTDDRVIHEYKMNSDITPEEMLADGCRNVWNCYFKLIEDGTVTDYIGVHWNNTTVTEDLRGPMMIMGIKANKDVVFLACDGRTEINQGLNFSEASTILLGLDVIDAYDLDGGGSASMIARCAKYNRNIDDDGIKIRNIHYTINAKKNAKNAGALAAFEKIGQEKQLLIEQIIPYINSLDTRVLSEIGEDINEYEDLNEYATGGKYYCQSREIAATLSNCPISNRGFTMYVMQHGGYIDQFMQLLITNNPYRFYYRLIRTSTSYYTDWERLVSKSELDNVNEKFHRVSFPYFSIAGHSSQTYDLANETQFVLFINGTTEELHSVLMVDTTITGNVHITALHQGANISYTSSRNSLTITNNEDAYAYLTEFLTLGDGMTPAEP